MESVSAPVTVEGLKVSARVGVDSTSGRVSLTDVAANAVEIDTVSGELLMYRATVHATLEIDTVSGYIAISEALLDEVAVDTVSADVSFANVQVSHIEADSTSGNLYLQILSGIQDIACDAVSGNVTVVLPADWHGFTVEFDTVSGDFSSDFSVKQSGSRREYGDGGTSIEADTTSGGLIIKSANAQ